VIVVVMVVRDCKKKKRTTDAELLAVWSGELDIVLWPNLARGQTFIVLHSTIFFF
jgi:hypothetical protein